jgi:hypothetical protein
MKYKLATTLLVVAGLVVATFSAHHELLRRWRLSPLTTTSPPPPADSTFYVDKCPLTAIRRHCDDPTVQGRQRDPQVG